MSASKFGITPDQMAYPHQTCEKDGFSFTLRTDGVLLVYSKQTGVRERPWFHNQESGKPWIPTWANFKSLAKQMLREGDLDDLVRERNAAIEFNKNVRNAAHDLYEALDMLLAYTRGCEALLNASESEQCTAAREALAKTRGEQEGT